MTLREALRERLKKLDAKATSAPWAWDARGEKINEWGLGVAFDKDEKPLAGRFNDDDAVYAEQVCHTEGATVNYNDAELICALRNNLPMIIAALAEPDEPIDMLLFCPRCQKKHVDAPEPATGWTNPPHATHTCKFCGLNWRPSNALTNGVAAIDCLEPKHAERIAASVLSFHARPDTPFYAPPDERLKTIEENIDERKPTA